MRIQYASDLHLEYYDKIPFPLLLKPAAPVLALAGDLGHPGRRAYRDLLHYCSRNWARVFVVAGNSELYSAQKKWSADMLLEQCAVIANEFPNVQFMNQTCADYGGITFLGATLGHKMKNRLLQREHTTAWVHNQLRAATKPVVLLSHHLPGGDSMLRSPLRAVICGTTQTTHVASQRSIALSDASRLTVCINPRGYPSEQRTGYSRESYIEISTERLA